MGHYDDQYEASAKEHRTAMHKEADKTASRLRLNVAEKMEYLRIPMLPGRGVGEVEGGEA